MAVMPALSLILSGWHMTLDRGGNGSALAAFALIWIALYSTFLLLSLVLGKNRLFENRPFFSRRRSQYCACPVLFRVGTVNPPPFHGKTAFRASLA